MFPNAQLYERKMFHALARVVCATPINSMQKAANNDTVVRSELKTVVRNVFGPQYTVAAKFIPALNFKRMATNLPHELLMKRRDAFEDECMMLGLDPASQFKVLESAVMIGYWYGMERCPHRQLHQFFKYTRSNKFLRWRRSLRRASSFLAELQSAVHFTK